MEKTFMEMLPPIEQDTFVQYSKSLMDLASLFKVARGKNDTGQSDK